MTTEIKRTRWSKFCQEFNQTNQFRTSRVSVKHKAKKEISLTEERPFVGLAITRKGRAFAGIELHTQRDMHEGDNLLLKFNLDNEEKTYIAKEAIIRKRKGQYLGVEFLARSWDGDPVRTYLKSL